MKQTEYELLCSGILSGTGSFFCVNCHNPPILIQDRWYVYEDTEKRWTTSGI